MRALLKQTTIIFTFAFFYFTAMKADQQNGFLRDNFISKHLGGKEFVEQKTESFVFDPEVDYDTTKLIVSDLSFVIRNARVFENELEDTTRPINREELIEKIYYGDDVSSVNVSQIVDFSYLFKDNLFFNQDISKWDVSQGLFFNHMFQNAKSFNQNINNWNMVNAKTLESMFLNASSFNQPLNNWNTMNVENFYGVFQWASSFDQDISPWNVIKGKEFNRMIVGTKVSDYELDSWREYNSEARFKIYGYYDFHVRKLD